jgi:hypothetical protein
MLTHPEGFGPMSEEIQYLRSAGWATLLATILGMGLLIFDYIQWWRRRSND